MKREIQLTSSGRKEIRNIELQREGQLWRVSIDGNPLEADAVEIAPHTFSVLLHGKSYELRVTPMPDGALKIQSASNEFSAEVIDPREWRGRHGALQAEGRQQIISPMPGKVVRILVAAGDKVAAGQGLVVVEAMKMQNEIRSPKSGTVEKVVATEGQAVNAGDVLIWVD
ncbi:MAG TPA: biotin/lipoyl-containing protein [Candidatus Acidoferrum sp.]|nr:biotin/lipoyl-containing protein [Candidatus Acidoferrum sp.]